MLGYFEKFWRWVWQKKWSQQPKRNRARARLVLEELEPRLVPVVGEEQVSGTVLFQETVPSGNGS